MKYILISILSFAALSGWAEDQIKPLPENDVVPSSAENIVEKSSEQIKAQQQPEKSNLSETQIALNLDSPKTATTTENPFFKMLVSLGVVGVLICGGILYLKRTGFKNSKLKPNQIKILTQYHLGPKKSLAIIRVAGESILIGITEQNIGLIKTLSLLDEDIPDTTPSQFNELIEPRPTATTLQELAASDAVEEEEFAMRGIKDIVSRKMKSMRSLQ